MNFLTPQWAVENTVGAAFSLREGGVSQGSYASLNVGLHVGDDPLDVKENRRRLVEALDLPAGPRWLSQVHGTKVLRCLADHNSDHEASETEALPMADAAITTDPNVVLAIQVADCLPVLLASEDGRVLGAAHAGWRGLAAGVIEATWTAMCEADPTLVPQRVQAWLGPCIGPLEFEVGPEVRETFLAAGDSPEAFASNQHGRWQADLAQLARQRLIRCGIESMTGGNWCTASCPETFFSHRRESRAGVASGRMVALLWRRAVRL